MDEQRIIQALHESAGQAIPADLDLWPAIRARFQSQRQPRRWARLGPATRLGWALLILVLMLGLAATAIAAYNKIIVIEPARPPRFSGKLPNASELATVVHRADFPVWVFNAGELVQIQELGEGQNHTVFLKYRLKDGRTFGVAESAVPPYDIQYLLDDWRKVGAAILEPSVDVNGYKAIVYRKHVSGVLTNTIEPGPPAVRWFTDRTMLDVDTSFPSAFSIDETLAIARSLRQAR